VSEFRYSQIEREILGALPELGPAAEHYWRTEGEPGLDAGPHVFFDTVLAAYVEVLLWLPASSRRDELLRRVFEVVELMLVSKDRDVQDLAFVGLYEGRDAAWLRLAREFVGPQGRAYLKRWNGSWSGSGSLDVNELVQPEILDGHNVRGVVAKELQIPLDAVPGRTYATEGPA